MGSRARQHAIGFPCANKPGTRRSKSSAEICEARPHKCPPAGIKVQGPSGKRQAPGPGCCQGSGSVGARRQQRKGQLDGLQHVDQLVELVQLSAAAVAVDQRN